VEEWLMDIIGSDSAALAQAGKGTGLHASPAPDIEDLCIFRRRKQVEHPCRTRIAPWSLPIKPFKKCE